MTNDNHHVYWYLLCDANDYFARLGGSGRYSGFREWHPIALIALLISGTKPPLMASGMRELHEELPRSMWLETGGLPTKLDSKLVEKNITADDLNDYLMYCKKYIEKLNPSDRSRLEETIEKIKKGKK